MLTLRGAFSKAEVLDAIGDALGLAVPGTRAIAHADDISLAWMSPDELLVLCPKQCLAAKQEALSNALQGQHAMVVDVSDARAVFTLQGPLSREVLAKLAPVDLAPGQFGPGEMRRTRLAQVAAAFWQAPEDEQFHLICFRSVAEYVRDLLVNANQEGSAVGHF